MGGPLHQDTPHEQQPENDSTATMRIVTPVEIQTGANELNQENQEQQQDLKAENEEWSTENCIKEYPTNSYGMIDFVNETSGTKRIRVSFHFNFYNAFLYSFVRGGKCELENKFKLANIDQKINSL